MEELSPYAKSMIGLRNKFIDNRSPFSSHLSNYWGRMWEYGMMVHITRPEPGQRVLDVGGTNTLFVYYLHELGCLVSTVDPAQVHFDNTRSVMNIHPEFYGINVQVGNGQDLSYFSDGYFDHVYSICVIEHLPDRESQSRMFREMNRVVIPGGMVGITYDYWEWDNPDQSPNEIGPFRSEREIRDYLIDPVADLSDLYGNQDILHPALEPGGREPNGPGASIGSLFMKRKAI